MRDYIERYLTEAAEITRHLDQGAIADMTRHLLSLRERNGRLFFLGVGGGAGNASHAVNDFRKIAGIEAYSPMDNISEMSARINDDGWDGVFLAWLKGSHFGPNDAVFVFSVGGGDLERGISANIAKAVAYAREQKALVLGVVGRDGGYTAAAADACVVVPTVSADTVTPHTESFQAVVWHLLVSHPALRRGEMKWESVK